MFKKIIVLLFVIVFSLFSTNVFAKTVVARSVSSGSYEDGIYKANDSSFSAKYVIDETSSKIVLVEILNNDREGRFSQGDEYDITNVVVSRGLSAFLVSRDKKGQNIVTGVREASPGVSEIIIIGEDFYEYCRASNGKFYLEYGEVEG